jgi:hypothetical protein
VLVSITDKHEIQEGLEKFTLAKASRSPGQSDFVVELIPKDYARNKRWNRVFLLVFLGQKRGSATMSTVAPRLRPPPSTDFAAYYNETFVKWVQDQVNHATTNNANESVMASQTNKE